MALRRQLMAEQWDSFAKILPKDAPSIQRQEMRRAFYAGGQAIMFKIISALAPESEPTETDLKMMSDLHDELNEFAQMVKTGHA